MKEDELNYSEDIKIERDALDKEWLGQASLYMDYAEALADAKKIMAKAHEKVKICRADLIVEAKQKLEKPTMQEVEAYYRRSKEHQDAKTNLITAEYEVDVLMGAVIAFSQRKNALENLVALWKGGYYSKPVEEKEPGKPMTRITRERSKETKDKFNKRVKERGKK